MSSDSNTEISSAGIISYIISIIIIIVMVIVYFMFGGLILYACKVAQSNILPTNPKCVPYTNILPDITSIKTNIFTTFTNPKLSEKLIFPLDDSNIKNSLLDLIREYKVEPDSNYLVNYFLAILEGLIIFDYKVINKSFSYLNYLPEPIIVLLGLPIFVLSKIILLILNSIYFIYLYFSKMSWFFKYNSNKGENKASDWLPVTCGDIIDFSMGIGLVIIFSILFIFIILFGGSFIPLIGSFYTFYTIFHYTSENAEGKKQNVLSLIHKLYQYYKVTIIICISILIIISTLANLGGMYAVGIIIALILLGYGVITSNLFISIKPSDLTEVVSNDQAKKTCTASQSGGANQSIDINNLKSHIKQLSKKVSKLDKNR